MLDKLKQLTKDTAIYGISTMVARFITFLLVPFYTNIFNPDEYGIITNLYAFIGLMNIIYIYGMDAAYMKFAASKENGEEKDIFSTPFISVALVGMVLGVIILLLYKKISMLLGIPDHFQHLILYLPLILLIDALAVIPFIKLRLERKAKTFGLFKILNIIITVLMNIVFIFLLRWDIEAVLISNLIASIVSLLLVFPSIRKSFHFSFNFLLMKRLLKFGLPYLPAGLASMIIQVIDRPIIEHLTNLRTLGIYQANYKLGIFMMLFVNMFQYAWQPFFLQEAKSENAKELFAKVLTYFTIAGSTMLVVFSLFIDNIVKFSFFGYSLIGSAYWVGLDIVPVVLFAYLFNGLYVIFTAGIFIKEKSIYVPLITGAGALVNILANLILIPTLGIMGAALATLASYFVMAAGLYFVNQKIYNIAYENWKMIKIFIVIGVIGFSYFHFLYRNELTIFIKIILLISFLIALFIFIIDKNEMSFIKSKLGSIKKK